MTQTKTWVMNLTVANLALLFFVLVRLRFYSYKPLQIYGAEPCLRTCFGKPQRWRNNSRGSSQCKKQFSMEPIQCKKQFYTINQKLVRRSHLVETVAAGSLKPRYRHEYIVVWMIKDILRPQSFCLFPLLRQCLYSSTKLAIFVSQKTFLLQYDPFNVNALDTLWGACV